jgi:hypothetical protein
VRLGKLSPRLLHHDWYPGGAHAESRRRPLRTPRRARRAWASPADPIDSASPLSPSAGVVLAARCAANPCTPIFPCPAPHDALIAPASQAKGVHRRSLPLTWEQAAHRGRVRRQTDAQRRPIRSDRPSGGTHFPTCATSAAAVSDRASDGCCECCVGGLAKTEPKENVIVPAPGSSEDVDLLEKGLGCTLPE